MHRFPGLLVMLALLAAAPPAFACAEAQDQEIDPCTGRPRVSRPLLGEPVPDTSAPVGPQAPEAGPAGEPTSADEPPAADTARVAVPRPRTATEVDTAGAERNRRALALGRLSRGVRSGPAASISVPTGLGASSGEVFVGVGYQARTRYTDRSDAGAVMGAGFGDARRLALEVALSSYSTLRSFPFETGSASARLHRVVGEELGVAAGWENLLAWGDLDAQSTLYVAATRLLRLRDDPRAPLSSVALTLGAGNGRFRSEADDAAGRETVNVFGAVGVRVLEPLSLVADWTGQDLNAGVSLTPLPRVPLVVTAGGADLTGSAGDGARFILSVGFGLAVPWRL